MSDPRVQFLANQYRSVATEDLSVKDKYLNGAQELTINTLLINESDAATEAQRQLDLRKVQRDYLSVKVRRSAIGAIPKLGSVLSIKLSRFGYNAGKLFVFIGFELQLSTDEIILQLWG